MTPKGMRKRVDEINAEKLTLMSYEKLLCNLLKENLFSKHNHLERSLGYFH